ncbi:MAG: hypothetical protein AB1489_02200 [Acidobacteriota bacterium]
MSSRTDVGRARSNLSPANKICLSCRQGEVSTERGRLCVFCHLGHTYADAGCPDYQDTGTATLLEAIQHRIHQTQLGYRKRFNEIHPDCFSCVQNCCTTPFLNRTPFYPEDAIYYLLRDQPLPQVPKGLKHCMFFQAGCTLPIDLRPHVCIEYKCIYQGDEEIDELARTINYATIDLLAVATRDYVGWRGEYTTENRPSLQRRGLLAGKTYDRFDREWDPQYPTRDLYVLYQVKSLPRDYEAFNG